MASSEYQYYILTQTPKDFISRKPGQICCPKFLRFKKPGKKLDVVFIDSSSGVDYPVDSDILQPISYEEAGLLKSVPVEDRLKALNQPQGLRPARRLKEGTEVWVEEGSALLQGTIRYIGSIDKSSSKWDVAGVFYGVELQGSDRGRGNTDGTHRYKKFFSCDKNCGVFAPFNRITAVGTQTSPDPHSKDSSDLKATLSFKSKSESRPGSNHDQDQPVSFVSNHFDQDPSQRETSPESRSDPYWDSGPKPLTADPESMDLDHVYEDPDQLLEPYKDLNDIRYMSDKQRHSSDKSKTDRKERLDLIPGSAKRVTAGIPESSEVDHVNSSSVPNKTRLATSRFHSKLEVRPRSQSESESKAPVLTKSGPKSPGVLGCGSTETEDMYTDPKGASNSKTNSSRPESKPGGPKPSLENVSTDELKAGDQVHYFEMSQNEEVFEGSVVYMENTEEGVVVHIAGESGTVIVPLSCVLKAETKRALSDTEDLYMGRDSTVPCVKREESCSSPGPDSVAPSMVCREDCSSLGLDSVVEIDLSKGVKGFGTIRWIGFLPGQEHKMAGLELEEQKGVSDGSFKGKRFFLCPERHALFVKLSSCRPDSRFYRTSISQNSSNQRGAHSRESTNHSGPKAQPDYNGFSTQNVNDNFDLEPVPPITAEEVERLLIGRMKGIQGHHNSCYMDSALFSLFSVSSVLDSLLFKSTSPPDTDIQRILLRDIVNPLRRHGFVEGFHVMNLRKQLQKHGFSNSFTTDEKDPEEFLTVIMQHILNLDPLIKLCSGGKVQDSFCFQIFLDQNQDLVLPTVQQLFEHSFHSNKLKLSEVPSCLILQMPRFGKKFKMFDKILPSLELDVTDLLQKGLKQCVLCGGTAQWECDECFLDPVFGSNGFKLFCDQCNKQVHGHTRRRGHHPERVDTSHRGNSDSFHGKREKLHLLAVLCIETSHYVSFVKYSPEPKHWLFFDSMADRVGEADGFNVPQVSLAPELSQYLSMSLSELANQAPRDMKGVAKRLLCDAYLYIYQSPALHLYT